MVSTWCFSFCFSLFILRFIFFTSFLVWRITPWLQELPPELRYDRSVMTYKITNNLSPENLWDKFQKRSSLSNYETRFCKNLQIPRLNTEHAKKSYYYSALKDWNDVPIDIRELPTVGSFKNKLKHSLKRCQYGTN